jgi:V8-like Glu-specific endopeptidase
MVEFRGSIIYGTAVFIDDKHLLTAGHCFYDKSRRTDTIKRIRVVYPGLPYVNYSDLHSGEIFTLDCTIIKNLFKGAPDLNEPDIALLHAGTGNGPLGTELSANVPKPGAIVDVIGYPQEPVTAWFKKKLKNINDLDETIKTVRKLLPYRTLTISRGTIKTVGKGYITYNVSTVPGMSGSCLVYEGKVIGIFKFEQVLIDKVFTLAMS